MHEYVPYNALVLIATFVSDGFPCLVLFSLTHAQVHAVLGIFGQRGQVPLHFKLDVRQLKETYDKLHRSLERVKSDIYHGDKLDNMLKEWADFGM